MSPNIWSKQISIAINMYTPGQALCIIMGVIKYMCDLNIQTMDQHVNTQTFWRQFHKSVSSNNVFHVNDQRDVNTSSGSMPSCITWYINTWPRKLPIPEKNCNVKLLVCESKSPLKKECKLTLKILFWFVSIKCLPSDFILFFHAWLAQLQSRGYFQSFRIMVYLKVVGSNLTPGNSLYKLCLYLLPISTYFGFPYLLIFLLLAFYILSPINNILYCIVCSYFEGRGHFKLFCTVGTVRYLWTGCYPFGANARKGKSSNVSQVSPWFVGRFQGYE